MSLPTLMCENVAGNQVFEPPVAPRMAPTRPNMTRKSEKEREGAKERRRRKRTSRKAK